MRKIAAMILLISGMAARQVSGGMHPAAEDEENMILAEKLSPYVVFVENETNGKYATGTLFRTSGAVIVTTYHVLDSSGDALHAFISTEGNKAARYPCHLVRADAETDLALFSVEGADIRPGIGLAPVICADNSELHRGIRIVFLGFPLNYGMAYDPAARLAVKQPVFRTGTIASEIDRGEFLADAMSSDGNSGSPVFIRVKGKRKNPKYRLAGIIKQFQHDTILFKDAFDKWSRIPHNTGLSVVIPAGEVRKFLEQDAGR